MINFLSVGIGASLGACLRYILSRAMPDNFPYGTLASNIIASLLIGFIIGIERNIGALPEHVKLMLITGFLGGLSTFSTFSIETVTMLEAQNYLRAGVNILLNVGLCLLCVVIGLGVARLIFQRN